MNDSGAVSAKLVKGQTYIVARTPTNVADSVLVTTRGAVALVVANPTSLSIFRGATATVTAELRDPAGNVILDRTATFSSSDDKIASVSAGGVVTAVAVGSANITATIEGKSATIPMTVTSPVAGVELVPSTVTLARPGDSQVLTARVVAAPGASVDGLVPTVTTSDAKVATVGEGRIFAINYGVATITATIENFTATTAVAVVSPLVLTPSKAERLPNGTQTFAVTSAAAVRSPGP